MNNVIKAYGCKAKTDFYKDVSSSGAVFSLLAEQTVDLGGVVYATALSKDCKLAQFIRVNNKDDIKKVCGSKYVQSYVGDTFKQVQDDLSAGIAVLFCGCPCQVNALRLFLKHDYDNLFCADIICHGVPSPKLWKQYLAYLEKKSGKSAYSVNFRYKGGSWKDFGIKISSEEADYYKSKYDDPYMQLFLKNISLRPSCYNCNAKNFRLSDLSLGDFWGVEKIQPSLYDDRGVSLCVIRTKKGESVFDMIKHELDAELCSYETAVQKNSAETKPVVKPESRKSFYRDFNILSSPKLYKKYLGSLKITRIKRRVRRLIKGGG